MLTWKRSRCYLVSARRWRHATQKQREIRQHRTAKAKSGKRKAKDDTAKVKEQAFVWTADEVELLLGVMHEYKVKKTAANVDWELVRSRYTDIWDNLRKKLPASPEEARDLGKDYPHTKEEITNQAVTNKLEDQPLCSHQMTSTLSKDSDIFLIFLLYYSFTVLNHLHVKHIFKLTTHVANRMHLKYPIYNGAKR